MDVSETVEDDSMYCMSRCEQLRKSVFSRGSGTLRFLLFPSVFYAFGCHFAVVSAQLRKANMVRITLLYIFVYWGPKGEIRGFNISRDVGDVFLALELSFQSWAATAEILMLD